METQVGKGLMFINYVYTYLHRAGGPGTHAGILTHRHLGHATFPFRSLFPPN